MPSPSEYYAPWVLEQMRKQNAASHAEAVWCHVRPVVEAWDGLGDGQHAIPVGLYDAMTALARAYHKRNGQPDAIDRLMSTAEGRETP